MVNDLLGRLMNWYEAHFGDDWENFYGIKIETLDNPGWYVKIDILGTELENKPFEPLNEISETDENGWIVCNIKDGAYFEGACDPSKLKRILGIFLDWAEK